MQIQKTNNQQPSKQSFGMKISPGGLYHLKNSVNDGRAGKRLVNAIEVLAKTPQPEKYELRDVILGKRAPSRVLIRDNETNLEAELFHWFRFTVPGTLKKLTDTKFVEQTMRREAVRQAKTVVVESNKDNLIIKLNELSK